MSESVCVCLCVCASLSLALTFSICVPKFGLILHAHLTHTHALADTFEVWLRNGSSSVDVPLLRTGIAWSTDKKTKFKNPKGESDTPV